MKRIVIMFLKNFYILPYFLVRLLYVSTSKSYAKKYNEEEVFAFIKQITKHANWGGRVKIEAHGLENLPDKNGYVMFPNHQGLYDVLTMLDVHPHPFTVVMKKELMKIPLLKNIFLALKALELDREDVRQSMTVILEMAKQVQQGRNFVIFAEGTRSRNGNKLQEFKGGSFKGAVKAKCPIVPVALLDSYKVFDTDSIAPVTVQLYYLKPLYYEDYKDMKTVEIAKYVKEQIENKIAEVEGK